MVDGVDLRDLDLAAWRKSIGVVSQDTFLFNDTIANNIALGRPDVDNDAMVSAAKQAYAHDFIEMLPQGYETQIGDRGWKSVRWAKTAHSPRPGHSSAPSNPDPGRSNQLPGFGV